MDVVQCIRERRSVRSFTDQTVSRETLDALLSLAVQAPTGSGMEPWGFVVIQDKAALKELSDRTKADCRAHLDAMPYLKQYEDWLASEKYNIFYNAGTLVVIYGNPASHWHVHDGTLAAGNLMLAAQAMGLGTCWIGFAQTSLNTPEFKKAHGVPEDWELVCPLILGYPKARPSSPGQRKAPVIFNRA